MLNELIHYPKLLRKMKNQKVSLNQLAVDKLHNFQSKDHIEDKGKMMCEFFNKKNRTTMFLTSILFMSLAIFWVVFDLIAKANMVIDKPVSLVGNSLLFASSALMFTYQLYFWKKKQARPIIVYGGYYMLIIVSVCLLNICHNISLLNDIKNGLISSSDDINYYLRFQGAPFLGTLCLISCCMAPLPRKSAMVYFGICCVVDCFLPCLPFMPGHEVYPLAQHVVMRICFAGIYIYNYRSESKRCYLERHLELISYTDEITKALNRTALETYVEIAEELNQSKDLGVILFDIDDFKKYNDKYSHPEGDKALKTVINIVFNNINKDREMVFRYGGEEFVILVPNTTKEETIAIANRIRQAVVDANLTRDDGALYPYITITMGADVTSIDANFIRKVDEQLYIGKRNNKNCVVYNGEVVSK